MRFGGRGTKFVISLNTGVDERIYLLCRNKLTDFILCLHRIVIYLLFA